MCSPTASLLWISAFFHVELRRCKRVAFERELVSDVHGRV